MNPTIDQDTNALIAEMEGDLIRLKEIATTFHHTPSSMDNSPVRVTLSNSFAEEKGKFNSSYVWDKSLRLEGLNPGLSKRFNQYVADHFGSIDRAHKAPSFMAYLFTPSPSDSA